MILENYKDKTFVLLREESRLETISNEQKH